MDGERCVCFSASPTASVSPGNPGECRGRAGLRCPRPLAGGRRPTLGSSVTQNRLPRQPREEADRRYAPGGSRSCFGDSPYMLPLSDSVGQGRCPAPEPGWKPRTGSPPGHCCPHGASLHRCQPMAPGSSPGARSASSPSLPQQPGAWGIPLVSKNTPLLPGEGPRKAAPTPLRQASMRMTTVLTAINSDDKCNFRWEPVKLLAWGRPTDTLLQDGRVPSARGQRPTILRGPRGSSTLHACFTRPRPYGAADYWGGEGQPMSPGADLSLHGSSCGVLEHA